ncbi:MAG: ATP-grasp fold amidoligase family protein [Gemmatimonadota bacterium]
MRIRPIKDTIIFVNRTCLRFAVRTNLRLFHWIPNHLLFFYVHRRLPDRERLNIKDLAFFNKYDTASIALGPFVDKETAKAFVRSIAPEVRVPKTFRVLRSREELRDLDLDSPYVAKPTHGSGVVVFKPEGGSLTPEELATLGRGLATNYYLAGGEIQYRYLEKKIIAEEFVGDPPRIPSDWKVHCYEGRLLFCTVILDRYGDSKNLKLDRDGTRLPISISSPWLETTGTVYEGPFDLPDNYAQIVAAAEKLSAPFRYCRIDLFTHQGEVYFGEITFSPGNCLFVMNPENVSDVRTWLGSTPSPAAASTR